MSTNIYFAFTLKYFVLPFYGCKTELEQHTKMCLFSVFYIITLYKLQFSARSAFVFSFLTTENTVVASFLLVHTCIRFCYAVSRSATVGS